jgi:hypothetical protein
MPRALAIDIKIEGLRETLKAFRDLPKDASAELRTAAGKIAEDMAGWIKSAAALDSPQSALMVPTVKVARDRVPAVTIGGARRVGSSRAQAYKILLGANFGARSFPQFREWAGKGNDFFVFRNIEAHSAEIEERYLDAADRIIRAWSQSQGV